MLRELGLAWAVRDNGLAELADVPHRVLRAFSRRRVEIEQAMAEHGSGSRAGAQAATLTTRKAKDDGVRPESLAAEWHRRADGLGSTAKARDELLHRLPARLPATAELVRAAAAGRAGDGRLAARRGLQRPHPGRDVHPAPAGRTRGPDRSRGGRRRHVTLALLTAIDTIQTRADELTRRIEEALRQHPDSNVFTSLPRAGQVRAAALLAEIADARGRYPTWASLAAAAGTCPVTPRAASTVPSGSGADAKLRRALTDVADDSRHANPWAADIYRRARARGMRHPHAVRVLARAWTIVIWRCWQNNEPYDPTRHGGLQRHRRCHRALRQAPRHQRSAARRAPA